MIGIVAEIAGLRVALGIVSALCVLIAAGGGAVGRPGARRVSGQPIADRVAA